VDELVSKALAGSIGYVWPFFEESGCDEKAYAGYVSRSGNRVVVSVLAPPPIGFGLGPLEAQNHIPDSLLAISEVHGNLIFDISRVGGHIHLGPKASSRHYYSRAIAVGFVADQLQSSRMYEMTAYFSGLEYWSTITGSESLAKHDGFGRPTEINMTIKAGSARSA
jgi:hypothetical protein